MSLSAIPIALALAMSLAALLARSFCAADALGLSESTPTMMYAVSGLFDTFASPLANTPGVNVAVEGGRAVGAATTTWGRLPATTAKATATAQTTAMAPEKKKGRVVGDRSFKSMQRKRQICAARNRNPHITRTNVTFAKVRRDRISRNGARGR